MIVQYSGKVLANSIYDAGDISATFMRSDHLNFSDSLNNLSEEGITQE